MGTHCDALVRMVQAQNGDRFCGCSTDHLSHPPLMSCKVQTWLFDAIACLITPLRNSTHTFVFQGTDASAVLG